MAIPRFFASKIYFKTIDACFTPKADVGSSSIKIFAPRCSARAIARVCLWPPESVLTALVVSILVNPIF